MALASATDEASGFSHKYVLARLHGGLRHGGMQFVGSTDMDGVMSASASRSW